MQKILTEENIKWFIGLLIPIGVTVIGWIYVYRLGQRNIKRDKRINTYISTFNFIKDPINEAIRMYSKLSTYIFLILNRLQSFSKGDLFYESNRRFFLESFNNKEFETLKNAASDAFLEFLYSWEQYEIVLLPIENQRHALQQEYQELIQVIGSAHTEYFTYFYCLNQGMEVAESSKEKLIETLQSLHDRVLDFFACIRDVNINLQNLIFEDLLGQTVEKRQVKDEKFLTIDSLLKKHNLS